MMSREVQKKFQWRNPDVLHCIIFGRAVEEQWDYAIEILFGPRGSS
jgi:hypothetical protein